MKVASPAAGSLRSASSVLAWAAIAACWAASLSAEASEARPRFPGSSPATHDVVIENLVPIPMRDGTVLYADVYRPVGAERYPVIVGRSPYGIERERAVVYEYPGAYEAPLFFARRGYVFVYQDIRGRYESGGQWEPFRNDINDGYDTIEWAAQQRWSNGKVAMYGVSYEGTVQWLAAMSVPPHLVTIVPSVASTSIYHNWITQNGAWRLAFNFEWGAIRMESRVTQTSGPHRDPDTAPSLRTAHIYRYLPLNQMHRLAGRESRAYREWLEHPDYDAYWKAIDSEEAFERITVPVLNIGGWFDIFRQGTLHGYSGMRTRGGSEVARSGTQLVMGAWGHWPSRRTGEMDFGETAFIDQRALALQWYEYWLKGVDNDVVSRAPVRVFVMGRNEWRGLDDFPPPGTKSCKLFLASDGTLSWSRPTGPARADTFRYDPADPAPSVALASDHREIESRADALTYTSSPFEQELEIIGPLKVRLFVSSTAPDTDLVARITDVHPDGRSIALAEGIVRARYRESTSHPVPMQPGVVYSMLIDLAGTALVVRKGHRLRLVIAGSSFPAFDRHPNTAESFGTSAALSVAHHSVWQSADHSSHAYLPVTARSIKNLPRGSECESFK